MYYQNLPANPVTFTVTGRTFLAYYRIVGTDDDSEVSDSDDVVDVDPNSDVDQRSPIIGNTTPTLIFCAVCAGVSATYATVTCG